MTTSMLSTTTSTPSAGNAPPAAAHVWLYWRAEPRCWAVGYFDPAGQWRPESDHPNAEDAARRVHWLNGGNHDAACVAARDRAEAELDRLQTTVDRLSTVATRWELQARQRARRLRELRRTVRR